MPSWKTLFKGDFIAAAELDGKEPTIKIVSVERCMVESLGPIDGESHDKKGPKERGVVRFEGSKRGWLLNRTNAEALGAMFGEDYDRWAGKRVTLYATMVQAGRKQELGIRVKGSPDIAGPVTFRLALPRKRPINVTLSPTGKAAQQSAPADDQDFGQPPPLDEMEPGANG